MSFRQFVIVSHRWLGLAASIVLAIAGVTGTLLVWPEIFPQAVAWRIGELHQELLAGQSGWIVVLAATVIGLALQTGGLWLWWPSKRLAVRRGVGVWRWQYDFHNSAGVWLFLVMFVLGVTALGRVVSRNVPGLPWWVGAIMSRLHTTHDLPFVVKVIYAVSSLGFLAQGISGVVMFATRPRVGARR